MSKLAPVFVLIVAGLVVAGLAAASVVAGTIAERGPYTYVICVAGGVILLVVGYIALSLTEADLQRLEARRHQLWRQLYDVDIAMNERDRLREEWDSVRDSEEQARIDLLWQSIVVIIGFLVLGYSVGVGIWQRHLGGTQIRQGT